MFTDIQKGDCSLSELARTGDMNPFKREEESVFPNIQKGGLHLIRTGQVRRSELSRLSL
jgi:hypothetical protein